MNPSASRVASEDVIDLFIHSCIHSFIGGQLRIIIVDLKIANEIIESIIACFK